MQNKSSMSERDSAVAEANVLSKNHDRDRDGNAALVKQLETQNVKLQEEISKLSDQAISLQNLSSRYVTFNPIVSHSSECALPVKGN